jgi:hypothetical protein
MFKNFEISKPSWPDEDKFIESVTANVKAILGTADCLSEIQPEIPSKIIRGMADIATSSWKAKAKMRDASGEVLDEMKRVYRHIEAILKTLEEAGVEVKDHTGDDFDYGLPLKVVTTQPTQGVTRERVVETIRPTVYWQQKIIQMGEVVIETPYSTEIKE